MKIIHDTKTDTFNMILTDESNAYISDNMITNMKKIISYCEYLKKENVIPRSLTFGCNDFTDITVFKTNFKDVSNNETIFIISENEKTRALATVKDRHNISFYTEIKSHYE